jgi:hypothetical protein
MIGRRARNHRSGPTAGQPDSATKALINHVLIVLKAPTRRRIR